MLWAHVERQFSRWATPTYLYWIWPMKERNSNNRLDSAQALVYRELLRTRLHTHCGCGKLSPMANEIVPYEMRQPLLDLIATGQRILGRLTRNDIRQIRPVIRQDLALLRELVAKLDAGFEASKDRPNGTGPVREEMSFTKSDR